ncbi:MAG TPA: hypothetical protein PKC12_05520 [Thiobacillaceae bacterium]|nr:hypothetical protein [Thiobacillaceae bacterium]
MRMMAAVLALLLGGCTGLQSADPASPRYAYATGWTAELHRPLTIAPGAATVRLQYGAIVQRNSVQEWDPFCIVEIDTVRDEPQVVRPGRFEVWRVRRSVNPVTARAASGFVQTHLARDDGGPSFLYFITEFRLRDPDQPALRGMRCAWDQMVPSRRMLMRHLTLEEIQHALGGWITLIPPKESL